MKHVLTLSLLLLTAASLLAPRAYAANEKIAVVDMVELILKHPTAQEIKGRFDKRKSEAQEYARKKEEPLRKDRAELAQMVDSDPKRRQMEKQLMVRAAVLEIELKSMQEEAIREYIAGLETLYSEIQKTVAAYARRNGIQIVFHRTREPLTAADQNDYVAKVSLRTVVHVDETLDITEQIKALFPAAPNR